MFMMFPLLLPPRVSVIKSLGTMFFPIEQELVSGKQHGQPSANEKMKALCSLLLRRAVPRGGGLPYESDGDARRLA